MMKKKNLMSLQALFILSEINKLGCQKKAAENLGISTDTIKKYITVLENEIGCQLLISNGRGLHLSARGKNLLSCTSRMEDIFNQIYEENTVDHNLKGDVFISMPLSISTNLMPERIGDFFEKYPDINLVTNSYMENFDFSTMDADIGLTFAEPNNSEAIILYKKVVECGYFASPKYLAKYGYPKDFDDMLANHWIISRVQLPNFMKNWKNVLEKAQHVRYTTNSTYAASEAVRYGGGIAIMPKRYNKEGFVCLDNFVCEENPTVYMVANKKSKDVPRVRTVINFYKKLLDNM